MRAQFTDNDWLRLSLSVRYISILYSVSSEDITTELFSTDVTIDIGERGQQSKAEFEERMKNPKIQALQQKKKNWDAHKALQPFIENNWLICPYCGKHADKHLIWKCSPDKSIKAAIKKASDNFNDGGEK